MAERNAAYRTAYHLVGWPTFIAIMVFMLFIEVEEHHLRALFWGFAIAAGLTPAATLAWREREP